jgi:aquaporin Z
VAAGAFAVGGVSGGAFKPAVALGACVLGIFKWSHYWINLVATLLGGAVGAGTFLYVQGEDKFDAAGAGGGGWGGRVRGGAGGGG